MVNEEIEVWAEIQCLHGTCTVSNIPATTAGYLSRPPNYSVIKYPPPANGIMLQYSFLNGKKRRCGAVISVTAQT